MDQETKPSLLAWLVTSSANPEQTSLTVKGALMFALPFIMHLTGIDQEAANTLVGGIVAFVNATLALVGSAVAIYGVLRKIKLMRWAHPGA